jgi:hypothetical protein
MNVKKIYNSLDLNLKILMCFNILCLIISFLLNFNLLNILLYLIIIDFLYILLIKILKSYKRSLLIKNIEDDLIKEILKISSYSNIYDIKAIINKLSRSENKIISLEFKNIKYKLKQGHNLESLFSILKKKYNSGILNRFLDLLTTLITIGTITNNDFKELVTNFINYKKIIDQRQSLLLMQKYTIILSSSFILPLVLGIVINLVKSLSSNINTSFFEFSINSNLFIVTNYCAIIYLLEFIIISSVYLGFLDNNSKKFIIYLIIQLPIALLIFFITKYLI